MALRTVHMGEAQADLTALSRWIDTSPDYPERGTELHMRRRIDKITEELGEVTEAMGGTWGENPRKGVTHTLYDVLKELLDVATAAVGAYESLTENEGHGLDALHQHIHGVAVRAGVGDQ